MDGSLDPKHNRAIQRELGERLSVLLSPTPNELPKRLRELVRQMERQERSGRRHSVA